MRNSSIESVRHWLPNNVYSMLWHACLIGQESAAQARMSCENTGAGPRLPP
jgi:hypothetical protein